MKRLLAKIYLYRTFSELMLLYPLYTVMFAERGHLNTLQISTLLGVWSIIILICEIPSGALADKYSRKHLLAIAQIIRGIGYTIWIYMPNFEGFLLGLALWGIGRSLTSGTFEALVFDELKAVNNEKQYARIIGRSESLALFFSLGSTLAAAPVFAWFGYDGVIWFSVAATILSSLVAFTLPAKNKQADVEKTSYSNILRQAIREVMKNPALLKLIFFGIFVGVLFRIFDEYASLILRAASVATVFIPLVSTLVFLPVIVADFFAYRLEHLRQVTFMILLIIAGISLTIAGKFLGVTGIVGLAVFMLLVKVSITVFGAKVQHEITGKTRATIISINSFGVEVGAVFAFFAYGLISKTSGIAGALLAFGLLTSSVGIIYLIATKGRLFQKRKLTTQ